ncbi:ABC transporter permease [Sulfurimonas sp.]|uniref:ABC transporter permease n=1 Tax=Sulfurimonas sp. TaxID=2022749 RepID=UPI002AB10FC8|nr:ABC transporter permease [Sulfurimonas sp.]
MKQNNFLNEEIFLLFKRYPLWINLAWKDITSKYKRTFLGPFWISLAIIIFISSISLVYSKLLSVDIHTYIPYLAFGIITWIFITSTVLESCGCFIDYGGYITQIKVPYLAFIFRIVVRNNIIFLHNIPIAILTIFIFDIDFNFYSLLFFIFNLFILNLNLIWISILLSIVSLRFRDVQQFISTMIQPIFFVTPVIWTANSIGNSRFIIDYNLFYYFVELIRGVFIPAENMEKIVLVSSITGVVGLSISLYIFKKFHKKISLWI